MNYTLEGNGKTLLFIHGLSDNLIYWEFLAKNLKKNYQILRVDLQGHGKSKLINSKLTIDTFVEDINNLLLKLNIDNVKIIGFSLGGAISLDFSIKYPEKVNSLVLMSSFHKTDSHLEKIFHEFENSLKISFKDFFDLILPMTLCPEVIENNINELNVIKTNSSKTANTNAYIKAIEACLNFNVENKLSEITANTLILAGKYDEITPPYIQKEMQNKILNSKLIILDDAKHNLLVGKNNPKISDILNAFFKQNSIKY